MTGSLLSSLLVKVAELSGGFAVGDEANEISGGNGVRCSAGRIHYRYRYRKAL